MSEIRHGDSLEVLRTMEENSVDSVVTDPPYGLVSIVKRFGKEGSRPPSAGSEGAGGVFGRSVRGFMGCTWDGSGIEYSVEFWGEVLRVMKPGAHLLAMGGTRTYHRMVCAIEDAGFECRDCVCWHYGSGFPKSHNVGDGWGTALKPATELIVLARKPLSEKTVAANVEKWGTGALNIDASRVACSGEKLGGGIVGSTNKGWDRPWRHSSEALEKHRERQDANVEKAESIGRWPANLILSHAECCVLVGTRKAPGRAINRFTDGMKPFGEGAGHPYESEQYPAETVEEWACVPGCPVRMLDEQSGESKSTGGVNAGGLGDRVFGKFSKTKCGSSAGGIGDTGGASRFFYVAKPSRWERNAGLEGMEKKMFGNAVGGVTGDPEKLGRGSLSKERENIHPTVKPISLCRYLIRLVTPPGGTILDPFLGSGTTLCAIETLKADGHDFHGIGIERDAEYVEIAKKRMAWYEKPENAREWILRVEKRKGSRKEERDEGGLHLPPVLGGAEEERGEGEEDREGSDDGGRSPAGAAPLLPGFRVRGERAGDGVGSVPSSSREGGRALGIPTEDGEGEGAIDGGDAARDRPRVEAREAGIRERGLGEKATKGSGERGVDERRTDPRLRARVLEVRAEHEDGRGRMHEQEKAERTDESEDKHTRRGLTGYVVFGQDEHGLRGTPTGAGKGQE